MRQVKVLRLTEALHYYSSRKRPSQKWMRSHYTHFEPTIEDEKARREQQNRKGKKRKKRRMKDIFD